VLVDQRGTGRSGLILARGRRRSRADFGERVREARGAPSPPRSTGASARTLPAFPTRIAAGHVAAVIRALRAGQGRTSTATPRHVLHSSFLHGPPRGLLHSVCLDSAYPVRDLDPVRVVRRGRAHALEIVSPGSVARLAQLLAAPPSVIDALALADHCPGRRQRRRVVLR